MQNKTSGMHVEECTAEISDPNVETYKLSEKTMLLLENYKSFKSRTHGVSHWERVAQVGMDIGRELKLDNVALWSIKAFGWTHDLWRTHDGRCRKHGRDGFENLLSLDCKLIQQLPEQERELIRLAIRYHSDGFIAGEAFDLGLFETVELNEQRIVDIVGCCWDADRLDLARIGMIPRRCLISTELCHYFT